MFFTNSSLARTTFSPYLIALIPTSYPSPPPAQMYDFNADVNSAFVSIVGAPFTGLYTDYIDITSPQLCQAQYVRDGNTNQGSNHRDLAIRLYVADETSMDLTANYGRPFTIHRQFKNTKIMKWTVDRSIDSIDLQLFDQYGNPLPNNPKFNITSLSTPLANTGFAGSNDFNITFTVDEHSDTKVTNY